MLFLSSPSLKIHPRGNVLINTFFSILSLSSKLWSEIFPTYILPVLSDMTALVYLNVTMGTAELFVPSIVGKRAV